jgi:hypothetical protein
MTRMVEDGPAVVTGAVQDELVGDGNAVTHDDDDDDEDDRRRMKVKVAMMIENCEVRWLCLPLLGLVLGIITIIMMMG